MSEVSKRRKIAKPLWLLVTWVALSAAWVGFFINAQSEEHRNIERNVEQLKELEGKQKAYMAFEKRLSDEIESMIQAACSKEVKHPNVTDKFRQLLDTVSCMDRVMKDHLRDYGYPGDNQLCAIVARSLMGLKLDIKRYNSDRINHEFDSLFQAPSSVDSRLEYLPCDVPQKPICPSNVKTFIRCGDIEFEIAQEEKRKKTVTEYYLLALLPPSGLALAMWGMSALYPRPRIGIALKRNIRSLILATITAPFFFVFPAEWIDRNGLTSLGINLTRDMSWINALCLLFLASAALVGGVIVSWWLQRTLSGNLFTLARKRLIASKRFSIVLGVLIGAPVFPWLWYVNFDPEWGSFIPYILVTPGMMILGYVIVASLVQSAFWCLDGLGEAEKDDFANVAAGQITKELDRKLIDSNYPTPTSQENSDSTAAVAAVAKIESEIDPSPPTPIPDVHATHTVNSSKRKPSRNYLIRHWRGEISLGVTYWVNGFLTVIAQSALVVILAQMQGNYSLRAMAVASIGVTFFSVMAWLWLVVGTWRSADSHVERGGSSQWAGAAKVMVVLSILGLASKLPTNLVPYVNELALIASGNDPIGDVEIKIAADGRSVIVRGTLREGSAAKIQTILDAAPGVTFLVLDSDGGRLAEAQQLALVVRTRNLDTYVEDLCASACTFVFLAGKNRAATPNARIGFHQPSFPGMDDDSQRSMTQDMMNSYRAAGLPKSFLQRISETSPEDMWYPTRDELTTSNVITSVLLDSEAGSIGVGVRSNSAVAIQGDLPLDQAARKGDLFEVKRLIEFGTNPNELTRWGTSALTGASGGISKTHTEIVRYLVNHGADVNKRVVVGTTALNEASNSGNIETVRVLLDAKADVNSASDNGYTPLLSAASRGHLEIVRLLIAAGAGLNHQTRNGGLSALHLASGGGYQNIVTLLIAAGARKDIKSIRGETYGDVAGRTESLRVP